LQSLLLPSSYPSYYNRDYLERFTIEFSTELKGVTLMQGDWGFLTDLCKALEPFLTIQNQSLNTGLLLQQLSVFSLSLIITLTMQFIGRAIIQLTSLLLPVQSQLVLENSRSNFDLMIDQTIYFLGTVLDPRIKAVYIKEECAEANTILANVHTLIKELYPTLTAPSQLEGSKSERTSIEICILQAVYKDGPVVSDMDRYFDTPPVVWTQSDQSQSSDWLLEWWKVHQNEYPTMSCVARDYLTVQSAEVDVERVFSSGRDLLGVRRASMSPETMQLLIVLHSYYNSK
jgi:hypothetical protein